MRFNIGDHVGFQTDPSPSMIIIEVGKSGDGLPMYKCEWFDCLKDGSFELRSDSFYEFQLIAI